MNSSGVRHCHRALVGGVADPDAPPHQLRLRGARHISPSLPISPHLSHTSCAFELLGRPPTRAALFSSLQPRFPFDFPRCSVADRQCRRCCWSRQPRAPRQRPSAEAGRGAAAAAPRALSTPPSPAAFFSVRPFLFSRRRRGLPARRHLYPGNSLRLVRVCGRVRALSRGAGFLDTS